MIIIIILGHLDYLSKQPEKYLKMLYIYKYMYAQKLSTYKMMIEINGDRDDKNIDLICLELRLYHAEM